MLTVPLTGRFDRCVSVIAIASKAFRCFTPALCRSLPVQALHHRPAPVAADRRAIYNCRRRIWHRFACRKTIVCNSDNGACVAVQPAFASGLMGYCLSHAGPRLSLFFTDKASNKLFFMERQRSSKIFGQCFFRPPPSVMSVLVPKADMCGATRYVR